MVMSRIGDFSCPGVTQCQGYQKYSRDVKLLLVLIDRSASEGHVLYRAGGRVRLSLMTQHEAQVPATGADKARGATLGVATNTLTSTGHHVAHLPSAAPLPHRRGAGGRSPRPPLPREAARAGRAEPCGVGEERGSARRSAQSSAVGMRPQRGGERQRQHLPPAKSQVK